MFLERNRNRIRVEIYPKLPTKTLYRLVNLIQIHGKKIKDAIMTRLFENDEERSYGKISKLSKAKLREIFGSLRETTIFIIQSPQGGGIGSLNSDFWLHHDVAPYLSKK